MASASQLQPVARLPRRNADLPLVVAVQAKCHCMTPSQAALVAMPQAHQRDLTPVERTSRGQMCRRPQVCLRDGADTAVLPFIPALTLGACQHPKRRVWQAPAHEIVWLAAGSGLSGWRRWQASVHLCAPRRRAISIQSPTCQRHQVALVLGAQVNPDGTPSAFLAARLDLAKRLYDAGLVEMIIVSGDHLAPEYDEPAAMRDDCRRPVCAEGDS